VDRIVKDGSRAGEIISRIRALAKKTSTEKESLEVNEMIQEVVSLVQTEVRRNRVALRTELADGLAPVLGDGVQLQQVVLNLMMNGIEAMRPVEDRPRELVIRTQKGDEGQVCVAVQDSGIGLDSENMDRIFDAWAWGYRLAARLLRITRDGCGRRRMRVPAPRSSSRLPSTARRVYAEKLDIRAPK
jgi:C4-dicarboxylate-specific signal transduction histidine kinase